MEQELTICMKNYILLCTLHFQKQAQGFRFSMTFKIVKVCFEEHLWTLYYLFDDVSAGEI